MERGREDEPRDAKELSSHYLTVLDLLDALMGDTSWQLRKKSSASDDKERYGTGRDADVPPRFLLQQFRSTDIAKGWISFVRFVRAYKEIHRLTPIDLLTLWLKGAALQGTVNETSWDLLIPVYYGSLDKWELEKFSFLVVRVKCCETGDTETWDKTVGPALSGDAMQRPFFVLFMDLGSISSYNGRGRADLGFFPHSSASAPNPAEGERQPRYVLRVRGCDARAYQVIEKLCIEKAMKSLVMYTYVQPSFDRQSAIDQG